MADKCMNEWQVELTPDFRKTVWQIILATILQTSSPLDNEVVHQHFLMFKYVIDIETNIYKKAENRGDYYHRLSYVFVQVNQELSRMPSYIESRVQKYRAKKQKKKTPSELHAKLLKFGQRTVTDLKTRMLTNILADLKADNRTDVTSQGDDVEDGKKSSCVDCQCGTETLHKRINGKEKFNKMIQELKGCHETEVCESYEGSELEQFTKCPKNPGHTNLIPVKEFTIDKLPEQYRTQSMDDFIKEFSYLTVKIVVSEVSEGRPDFIPESANPYPFSDQKGSFSLRNGTGRICNVFKYNQSNCLWSSQQSCTCEKCDDNPSKVWGEIFIFTATHLIFDDAEARKCKCELFFDSEDSPGVKLSGVSVVEKDVDKDWCRVKFVTCDLELVERLAQSLVQFFQHWYRVYEEFKHTGRADKLAIIVSHPHGCSKHISLGRWEERHSVGRYYDSRYSYTASTCRGSSGATVHLVGVSGGNLCWFDQHIHSGSLDNGLNYSGTGWENKYVW